MFDIKALNKAIEQLAGEKDLNPSQVLEAVEAALASAYKKEYDKKGEVVRCTIDAKANEITFFQVKTVVDENTVRFPKEGEEVEEKQLTQEEIENLLPLYNSDRHILIEDARKVKSDAQIGEELIFDIDQPTSDFGRIAAQTAKQVVLQKLREIEKSSVKSEFESKIGTLVSGIVQRVERGNVFVDLGKASGVMFFSEGIPGEHYRIGERLKFYLSSVQEGGRGPQLVLSRSHPKFIEKLFELEVPEIADGVVQVKGIVREPGSRTKIAVASTAEGVDPVGACVGQRGARVMAVNSEVGSEKIDIIDWSEDESVYVGNSLSPATASSTKLKDHHEALVLVPEDQLSLAIGKGGQNVRLAAKLTGWKIDVRSQSNPDIVQSDGTAVAEEDDSKKESDDEE
ncbi:MAG TPA: transcription termination factor NusA [Candidatus Paceibacterota bacterium]|nr:transcription termination factor NusA [Candidatus Paceibacterota bacterium]